MPDLVVKQVIVIRRDLGMRRGKEIAQGAHASMMWLTHRLHMGYDYAGPFGKNVYPNLHGRFTEAEIAWVKGNFRKITCQVPGEPELLAVLQAAKDAGVEAHLVTDNGATEFDGVPTRTAVAIGPDYSDKIDKITGTLRLY